MPVVTKVNEQGRRISPPKETKVTEPIKNVEEKDEVIRIVKGTYKHKNKRKIGKDDKYICIEKITVGVACEEIYCAVCGSPYIKS